ncbi:MAG: hypothetical protein EXS49_01545 [Candidatus Pacebacteria bacterium]|nr:hypothetical protein [Candidatus Paceibacterota bacterium]
MNKKNFNLDYVLWISAMISFLLLLLFSIGFVLFLLNNFKEALSRDVSSTRQFEKFKIDELDKILNERKF